MSLTLITLLAYTVAFPAGVGLYFYRRIDPIYRPLIFLFSCSVLVEILSTASRNLFQSNLVILQAYTIGESWFLLTFISSLIKNQLLARLIKYFRFAMILIVLLEMILWPASYGSVSVSIESISVMLGIIVYFFEISTGKDTRSTSFYFSGVLLFYMVSNFIYFATFDWLASEALLFVANVHTFLNAICNILFGVILWKASRSKSQLLV